MAFLFKSVIHYMNNQKDIKTVNTIRKEIRPTSSRYQKSLLQMKSLWKLETERRNQIDLQHITDENELLAEQLFRLSNEQEIINIYDRFSNEVNKDHMIYTESHDYYVNSTTFKDDFPNGFQEFKQKILTE